CVVLALPGAGGSPGGRSGSGQLRVLPDAMISAQNCSVWNGRCGRRGGGDRADRPLRGRQLRRCGVPVHLGHAGQVGQTGDLTSRDGPGCLRGSLRGPPPTRGRVRSDRPTGAGDSGVITARRIRRAPGVALVVVAVLVALTVPGVTGRRIAGTPVVLSI